MEALAALASRNSYRNRDRRKSRETEALDALAVAVSGNRRFPG
jgi:hypothetical protein